MASSLITHRSFAGDDRSKNLQSTVPSSPAELYDIVDKNAASFKATNTNMHVKPVNGRLSGQRYGNRNPYLPYLSFVTENRGKSSASAVDFPASEPVVSASSEKSGELKLKSSVPMPSLPAPLADQNPLLDCLHTDNQTTSHNPFPATINNPASTTTTSETSADSSVHGINRTSDISSVSDTFRQSIEQVDHTYDLRIPTRIPPKLPDLQITSRLDAGSLSQGESSTLSEIQIKPPASKLVSVVPHTIAKLDKKCYVSTDMPKPVEITRQWDEIFQQLLRDALQHSVTARDDSESALALEFYMAGKSPKDLRPSILITCCSSKKKKALKSVLGDLRWLKESNLQYFVIVDKSFGYRAGIGTSTGAPLPFIAAQFSDNSKTLCGVSARITPSLYKLPNEAGNTEHVRFTIGGLLCIDGHYGYLTAGHPFVSLPPKPRLSISSLPSLDSEDDDTESTSSSSHTGLYNEPEINVARSAESGIVTEKARATGVGFLTSGIDPTLPFRMLPHQGLISNVGSPFRTFNLQRDYGFRSSTFDWAFIIASPSLTLPNFIRIPDDPSATFIHDVLHKQDLASGQVWVASGSGLLHGTLNATPVTVFLGGRFQEVRQITLERCLGQSRI